MDILTERQSTTSRPRKSNYESDHEIKNKLFGCQYPDMIRIKEKWNLFSYFAWTQDNLLSWHGITCFEQQMLWQQMFQLLNGIEPVYIRFNNVQHVERYVSMFLFWHLLNNNHNLCCSTNIVRIPVYHCHYCPNFHLKLLPKSGHAVCLQNQRTTCQWTYSWYDNNSC